MNKNYLEKDLNKAKKMVNDALNASPSKTSKNSETSETKDGLNVKSIERLLSILKSGDLSNPKAKSGQKYIGYDKTSTSGRYAVRIVLDKKTIRDKRFPDLDKAIKYRDGIIPEVISELEEMLK